MVERVPKPEQVKKIHHYVWAHYLKKWAVNLENDSKKVINVWCRTKTNKVVIFNARAMLYENLFYSVRSLEERHLKLVQHYFGDADEGLKKSVLGLINYSRFLDAAESFKVRDHLRKDMEKAIELGKSNPLENIHTHREDSVIKILDTLVAQDLSILDNHENMLCFLDFFAHQMMRTKAVKRQVLDTFNRMDKDFSPILEECWWIFSATLGNRLGASIYCNRKIDNHCLLINNTDEPFITSDNPVIDILSEEKIGQSGSTILFSDDFDLYYPLSPNVAYIISRSHRFPKGKFELSVDDVHELNQKIAKKADTNIMGNTKEIIDKYKKFVE